MTCSSIGAEANTFSICAVDPATGEAGVAVASRCLSVGGLVPFARPGVGAIASQAFVNPVCGPKGLALLAKGLSAQETIDRLTEADFVLAAPGSETDRVMIEHEMTEEGADFTIDSAREKKLYFTSRIRQLGVVDREGNAAVHTGARVSPWCGSIVGDGFCCQGNLLAGEQVISDMATAFERARGAGKTMVAQLLAALEAGDEAGGDKRGKQAAGMLVVRDRGGWTGSDAYCDLRVDDHADPVAELARILNKIGMAG